MSLRGDPVEQEATLPDGRHLLVRVAVAPDSYIARSQLTTVALELVEVKQVVATVNTLLSPRQVGEARNLVSDVVKKLQSGELQPTAAALEPLADSVS
ncbi:MAG TPA: hypothetical protein VKO41_07915 [Gaiellaceae bacterium]|nr:hypothetical protein [Gaiellaceae bacterium]